MAQAKRKSVSDAEAADRQRLNIRLTPEDYRRLGVHALYMGVTPGALVGKLIREHLREFRVQVNIKGPGASLVSATSEVEMNCAGSFPISQS